MIAVLLAILGMVVIGLPLTLAVDRDARGGFLLGMAFLYGSGASFLTLLCLSIVHVRWTVAASTVPLLLLAAVAMVVWRKGDASREQTARTSRLRAPTSVASWAIDLLTLVSVGGYALYTTLAGLWEWDFWAIWGLKARVFAVAGGIDWRFLESRWNDFAHPDYPLLLVLNLDFVTLVNGAWSDRWLGLLFLAYGAAILLIVHSLAREETSAIIASAITLSCAVIALTRYVGLAEGPLIALGGAALLLGRRALLFDDKVAFRHFAILLGLAASTKNEGMALLVAAGAACLFLRVRPRDLRRLWPALAIPAPWLLLRSMHALTTDLARGSMLSRAASHLQMLGTILRQLTGSLVDPGFWILAIVALILVTRESRKRESFVLLATAIQLAFYLGSYLVTPNDLHWHIATSWSRLTRQVSIPLTYVVMMMLANFFMHGEDSQHAEAGRDI